MMDVAKIFWSGRSQAVRLPKAFRIDADAVRIRRRGNALILEPVPQGWAWLEKIVGELDDDFTHAANDRPAEFERPELDVFG